MLPLIQTSSGGQSQTTYTSPGNGSFFWGGYGVAPWTSGGTVTLAPNGANEVTVCLFYVPVAMTINKIVIDLSTHSSSTGIKANFGLYNSSGSLLLDSGGILVDSTTTIGAISVSPTAITLQPGYYYFAYGCGDNVATFGGIANLNTGVFETIFVKNVNRIGKAANSISANALPPTLGAITPGTGVGMLPACLFET